MPNTPAQIGRGSPSGTPRRRSPKRSATRPASCFGLSARNLQVEDEKFVEMATAVSGTGPAYVFLVMEALIDAAVQPGLPRHVAHDLVIETLEGSTAFAKATAQHPAVLRKHGHLAGRHERRRDSRARVRAAADGALGGGLGLVSANVGIGRRLEKGLGLNEGQTDETSGRFGGQRSAPRGFDRPAGPADSVPRFDGPGRESARPPLDIPSPRQMRANGAGA